MKECSKSQLLFCRYTTNVKRKVAKPCEATFPVFDAFPTGWWGQKVATPGAGGALTAAGAGDPQMEEEAVLCWCIQIHCLHCSSTATATATACTVLLFSFV